MYYADMRCVVCGEPSEHSALPGSGQMICSDDCALCYLDGLWAEDNALRRSA